VSTVEPDKTAQAAPLAGGPPVQLQRNAKGELIAAVPGRPEPVVNVTVARCFPWSHAEEYISIRDKEGKELVLLETLAGLDDATRRLVLSELHDKVFVPKIRRITEFKAEFEVVSISAETDRGRVTFQIRNRDDVRTLSLARAIFRDVDGNAYEVEDFHALDRASQRHLEQYF
jgi:hypothetical protein